MSPRHPSPEGTQYIDYRPCPDFDQAIKISPEDSDMAAARQIDPALLASVAEDINALRHDTPDVLITRSEQLYVQAGELHRNWRKNGANPATFAAMERMQQCYLEAAVICRQRADRMLGIGMNISEGATSADVALAGIAARLQQAA